MRLFAAILNERAKAEPSEKKISTVLLKHLSRKDLIEIITKIYDGKLPEELNKVETENAQLLELIGDDLFVISYMTEKWSKEAVEAKASPVAGPAPEKKETPETKSGKKE